MNEVKEGVKKGLAILSAGVVNLMILPFYGASASTPASQAQEGMSNVNPDSDGGNLDLYGTIRIILNTVFGVVGIIAVIMVILGGINYATSMGDPGKVKKAKDTITYGLIGLVVALLAFAIVNFVLNALQA